MQWASTMCADMALARHIRHIMQSHWHSLTVFASDFVTTLYICFIRYVILERDKETIGFLLLAIALIPIAPILLYFGKSIVLYCSIL